MQTIAVIGAGRQGRAFAFAAAQAGFRVILEDVLPSKLRMAQEEFRATEGTLEFAVTVEDAVREADFAIDFVPDELESKLEIISMVDRMAPPKTILLILTSALDIDDLASCTYRAERCVCVQLADQGLRVVGGTRTSPEVLGEVERALGSLTPFSDRLPVSSGQERS